MIPFIPATLLSDGSAGVILGDSVPVAAVLGKQGYAQNLSRGTTTAVAASDARQNAVRYTESGVLRMYNATGGLPANSVIVDGLAVSSDGQLCYTTATPSSPAYIGGMAVNQNGAVHITDMSAVAWYMAGVGQTNVSGACSVWADQSGNSRNLTQGTGANRPAIQSDGSLIFDGTDDYMESPAFALPQPFTIYLVLQQISYTDLDTIYDSLATSFTALYQRAPSPNINMFCVADGPSITTLSVGTTGVHTAVFNGASSLAQLNNGTAATGNPGATAMDGLTLGARNDLANFANVRVWEMIVRTGADSAAARKYFVDYLRAKYQV